MDKLYLYINDAATKPFEWGITDCMMFAADWVEVATGINPAIDLKYTYSSRGECQRFTRFFSDPVGVVSGIMRDFETVNEPKSGDVAVVEVNSEDGKMVIGAIWAKTCWVFKSEEGVITLNKKFCRPLKIWRVGYEK